MRRRVSPERRLDSDEQSAVSQVHPDAILLEFCCRATLQVMVLLRCTTAAWVAFCCVAIFKAVAAPCKVHQFGHWSRSDINPKITHHQGICCLIGCHIGPVIRASLSSCQHAEIATLSCPLSLAMSICWICITDFCGNCTHLNKTALNPGWKRHPSLLVEY